jgi:hypothetical protein
MEVAKRNGLQKEAVFCLEASALNKSRGEKDGVFGCEVTSKV